MTEPQHTRPFGDTTLVDAVLSAVKRAGDLLFERCPARSDSTLEIDYKGRRDLVTNADRNSEDLLRSALKQLLPHAAILSEESPDPGIREGDLWIVDPLDGTTNYAHGHPMYAVSVALVRDGSPILGVIHAPELMGRDATQGSSWWALRGHGAIQDGIEVTVSNETEISQSLLATGFSYGREELDHGALDIFRKMLLSAREVRRAGSACLDLAHVASGVFSGMWESDLKPHDVAAGALIIEEANGLVTDFSGGGDWLYGRTIVAGNATIHRNLIRCIQRNLRD